MAVAGDAQTLPFGPMVIPYGVERPPLPAEMKALGLAISLRVAPATEIVADGTVRSSSGFDAQAAERQDASGVEPSAGSSGTA